MSSTLSRTFLSVVLMVLFLTSLSLAQVPKTISYQGILTDTTGATVPDGNYSLTMKLYNVATGGAPLWTDGQLVAVSEGIFNVILGNAAPLNLPFSEPYWLGVTVGSGSELMPRIQLTSAAYSFRSANTDSINDIGAGGDLTGTYPNPTVAGDAITTTKLADNAVTTAKILDQAVTQTKLAPGVSLPPGGSAGGDLTGTYPNPTIADNAVTTAKIPDQAVTQAKLAPGVSLPPGGSAGGDLTGTYPNPTIANNAVTTTKLADNAVTSAKIQDATIQVSDLAFTPGNGDITGVAAGTGMSGGGTSGDVTLNVAVPLTLSGNSSSPNSIITGTNSGTGDGVYGYNSSSGSGVHGQSSSGFGVSGNSSSNTGVYGFSGSGTAVYGYNYTSGNVGYLGNNNYGVHGSSTFGIGVQGLHYAGNYGYLGSDSYGVYGYHNSTGNDGYLGSIDYGAYGYNNYSGNYGYLGSSNYGVYGRYSYGDSNNYGYLGSSYCGVNGYGSSSGVSCYGNSYGVYAETNSGKAVYGYGNSGSGGYAGYFDGRVNIVGTLSKGGGSFKIDHPLDPANKYLYHSFVESPDMMNIYNGNVITDANGDAIVELPEWFEAVNRDFRYQLTVIGQFAQAIVNEKVHNNRFTIKTDKPNVEVSWQVTGIRHDAFAEAHRIQVEVEKTGTERGKYIYPKEYGVSEVLGIDYEETHRMQEQMKDEQQKMKVMEEQQRIEQQKK